MVNNTGGFPSNFHQGTRAEYLAQFALSRIGLVVPVPRQSDHFLTDLFVHLGTLEGKDFIPTGPTIAVQVKSNCNPIDFDDRKLGIFLRELAQPYFIAVVDVAQNTVEIYSTQERLNHAHFCWTSLQLRFGEAPTGFSNDPSRTSATLFLGRPIWSCPIPDLDANPNGPRTAQRFHKVLSAWARLESFNLAWHAQGFPLFARPAPTESNESPDPRSVKFIKIVTLGTLESAVHHLGAVTGALRQIAEEQHWEPLERACAGVLGEINKLTWQNAGDSTTT